MQRNPHFDFSHLSGRDRVQLALDLWESLEDSDRAAAFPMTPELAAELDRRRAEMEADGDLGRSWEEVRAEIEAELETEERLRRRGA